jgi:uncharacterized protein (DUF2336 family)
MNGQQQLLQEIEVALAGRPVDQRTETLRHVTDLFLSRASDYSDEQVELFDDVIMRLATEIETSARILLAQRLAPVPNAPRNVIRDLAFDDEVEVASPVLMQSVRLDDATLVENARSMGQEHMLAISKRKSLAGLVTEVLVERGDRTVVLSVVGNAGAQFSDMGFSRLVMRSQNDDEIAAGVGRRHEIPRHHFLKLLAVASQSVRAKLQAENPQAIDEVHRVVREVTNRVQARSITESYEYSKARKMVAELCADRALTLSELGKFASAGQFEETVIGLSMIANIPVATIERAMLQERTELLLGILKSIGLPWADVKQVLQLRARHHAMSATDVDQCLANYERLKPATARLVVDFHCRPAKNPL